MRIASVLLAAVGAANALTIAEINGNRFISPYNGQAVTNITGLVTAKGSSGFYIRSTTPDNDPATSESIYVFGSASAKLVNAGDIVMLDGKVSEFRSTDGYMFLTEIGSPKNVVKLSSNNTVKALVIGVDTPAPPTVQYTSLDNGDVFGVPNGVSNISVVNPVLEPTKYGLDFWESINGELVTVKNPVAIARANNFGDTWIVGDWVVTGRNAHGGVTMTDKDANPEAISIADPLDGTNNPKTVKMGDQLAEITGIVSYAFGFYAILPLTKISVTTPASAAATPVDLVSSGDCRGITIGDYNVENMAPTSTHIPKVADHIVNYLKTPDLMMIQEIQDNSGPTNDGTVDANATLTALVTAIAGAGGGTYSFLDIDPVNNQDGGQLGGNIRVAYLYKPDVIELYKPNPGGSLDANEVLPGPELKYNPGRIDPANGAWNASRKPVAAMWRAVKGPRTKIFFTIDVHFSSKGGSTSLHGDVRPPINGVIAGRTAQAEVAGSFIGQILQADPKARVIAAGDFNDFTFTQPMKTFAAKSGLVDLDTAVGIPENERYTYLFDMNAQELDHMLVSPALASTAKFEHVHVNSWASSADEVSDHDPSVALLNLCGC